MEALHFQARDADVLYRKRLKRRTVWIQRCLRGLGGTIHFNSSPSDYAVCGARLTGTSARVARSKNEITCAGCKRYYAEYIG
jgi:hypothetical protein